MKRVLAILILALLAVTLAACGSGSGVSGGAGSSSKGSGSASTESAAEEQEPAKQEAEDPGKVEYDRACALFDEGKFYSAKVAFEESAYDDWEKRAAECVRPMPATGEVWHNSSLESDEMQLVLTVEDQNADLGRYFAVYTDKKELAETVFIKGPGSVETWLPGGNYYIKDATGTEWYGDIEMFGPDGHYESMVFDEIEDDRYLTVLESGYAWEITVNSSSGEGQGVGSEEGDWEDW